MKKFIVDETGFFVGSLNVPKNELSKQVIAKNHQVVDIPKDLLGETDLLNSHFFKDEKFIKKQKMNVVYSKTDFKADGIDTVFLNFIPIGASVTIAGAIAWGPTIINDEQLVISSNKTGLHQCVVRLRPYFLDWTWTFNAT